MFLKLHVSTIKTYQKVTPLPTQRSMSSSGFVRLIDDGEDSKEPTANFVLHSSLDRVGKHRLSLGSLLYTWLQDKRNTKP